MNRSWITPVSAALVGAIALVVASPLRGRLAAGWLPDINFALGVSLTLLAFVSGGRAAAAWLSRSASLGWIAGGLLLAIGLFTTGASSIVNAFSPSLDWGGIAGIVVGLAGAQLQYRASRAQAT